MPACWSLLVIGHVVHAVTVGDYFDSFPSLESDFGQDDLYGYGSSFRDLRRGGGSAYDDYFGGPYGGFGSFGHADRDRKESGKDSGKDCSRIEADGIPLADLLREAAENLPQNLSETPAEILELVRFFSSQEQRRFLLTHCPQAVALSVLLEAEIEAKKTSAGRPVQDEMLKDVVSPLGELLQLAPTLRSPYKAPPVWTGKPWGDVLNSAQHRTGVVLFPIGEQQFHVDFVSAVDWSIWANRRCRGRRDLGNLQGVPLASCLEKCSLHPSCRSATFWHWQPGGMGFDQRCFLSSSCTYQLSTDEGAEGAFLFEKLALLSVAEQDLVHERLRSPNAAWAPRAGHQLLAANSGNGIRLLLMGGIGVDPFVNTTQDEDGKKMTSQDGKVAKHDKKQKGGKGKGSAQARSAEARSRRQSNFTGMLNVVQAYLSRHVELSGELPPLRSLPYGRLGDLWMSEDEGTSWTLLQQKAPWGPRAFFGAAAVDSRLLVFGGIRTPEASSNQTDDLPRQYVNDVWTAALPDLVWRELPAAPWEARAGFQALAWQPDKSGEEILLFGGRLERGDLKNDVWALRLDELDRHSDGSPAWRLVTAAASWCPRSDFASAFAGQSHSLWIFGGSGQDGRALADVWRSTDGASWFQVQAAASWGPRIGATAVTLQWQADVADVADVMLLFGGYSYFDDGFGPIQPGNASDKGTAWISTDGTAWSPLPPDSLAWTQGTMHAASVVAPCDMTVRPVKAGQTCSYVTGGISDEGYFDNAVRRLQVGQREDDLLKSTIAKPYAAGVESLTSNWSENPTRTTPTTSSTNVKVEHAVGLSLLLSLVLLWTCLERAAGWTDPDKSNVPPSMRCLTRLLFGMVALLFAVGGVAGTVLLSISKELAKIRTEAPTCQIDDNLTSVLWHALGLAESAARWDEFEVLLRLASHESQYGYGFGYGAGGKASDIYGTRYDRGYDAYGPYDAPGPKEAPSLKKELSLLPTIQSVSCRTPKCDRNATCLGASRSLASPYGCCSDYMMVMLNDITSWLKEQDIPYFITYGTLLGAVREKDILPWTQDMDIVVDRSHWPKLQQGLEAAEFFGGRRYLFGVDQWEERVSRVCADWEGFATSIVGGQESDRFSRPTDFHLDVYASDWWQITDLHLVDCVEPLGVTQLEIRGRNFSAPARPRACVEKLYGAEWRIPKRALAGVN